MKYSVAISTSIMLLVVSVYGLAWPQLAAAQVDVGKEAGQQAAQNAGLNTEGDARSVIITVINFVLSLTGVLAVAMLVYAGIRYITAFGDEGKAEKAKEVILQVVIGLVLIILSAVIVNTVLTQFLKP